MATAGEKAALLPAVISWSRDFVDGSDDSACTESKLATDKNAIPTVIVKRTPAVRRLLRTMVVWMVWKRE